MMKPYSNPNSTNNSDSANSSSSYRQDKQMLIRNARGSSLNVAETPPIPFAYLIPKSTTHTTVDPMNGYKKDYTTQVKLATVRIVGSASNIDEFPPTKVNFSEIALAGRSNVGKSTLLNTLLYGQSIPVKRYTRGHVPDSYKLNKGTKVRR
jgi:hypothetical protein